MSHRLQVLIPEELDAEISKAARRRSLSKGEWVRQALREALDRSARAAGEGGDSLRRLASLEGPTGEIETLLAEIVAGRSG